MRIVFFNPAAELGGGERSLLDVMACLRAADPAVSLGLLTAEEGPLATEAGRLGAGVVQVPMPAALAGFGDSALKFSGRMGAAFSLGGRAPRAGLAAAGYVRRLAQALRGMSPDLIHSNDNKSHILACLARPEGVPVVWHVRDFIGSRGMVSRALRWASLRAAGAIANSRAVGEDARAVLGGLPVEVIHNAIDLAGFSPGAGDGAALDRLAGVPAAPEGTVRVGLVATFGRWKGQDLFLEAIARVIAAPPARPVRFYIVGGPIYRTAGSQFSEAELRDLAARLKVAGHVAFTGFQRDTVAAYRALDVVVHASTQPEPFGRAIVEAMACARAVIVSDAGGASELFVHDRDAMGCAPNDAGALAAAIGSLIDDPSRRARLGAEARRSAELRFSRTRLGREVGAAYARFTGGRLVISAG